jgi:pimeloyl-ACP methyl ester carboxylesterase
LLAAGVTDFPNDFFIDLGALAAAAPSAPSPYLPDLDNRGALAVVLGQTFLFAPFSPWYHLLAPTVDAQGEVTGYAAVDEAAASAWLAGATAHQAARESGDFDRLLCGEGAMPIDAPLARIQIPVLYLGAAGGAGELGVYTTTQVSSTDVTAIVARRHPPGEEVQDVGHGDLLFAADAEALAWEPLRAWLVAR